MNRETRYFVVKDRALLEILIKVVQVKKLLNGNRDMSVKEAAELVQISRSSYYKYKDDIFPFDDGAKGRTITLAMEIMDEPGLLSELLHRVALYQANILTIHQSVPVGGVANISLSVEMLGEFGDISAMVEEMGCIRGIRDVKILARE